MGTSDAAIIVAGQRLPVNWDILTFENPAGFNAHVATAPPRLPAKNLGGDRARCRKRRWTERSLAAARSQIKQFVIHLDGCKDATMCFDVLHNERGLSCHFILDNFGMLYQTLDLADCAFHAAGLNETSIGIEICNRGDANPDPSYYEKIPGMLHRDVVMCEVNESKYAAFEFTKPQYEAMAVLGKALARHLPGIKLDYPQIAPGVQAWKTLLPDDPTGARLRASYSGYLGHYHITAQKWDPGPFDFKKYVGNLSGRRSFPIGLHALTDKTDVPEPPAATDERARAEYEKAFDAYYANNELEGKGGFFPVGPLDAVQVYHGGIHLHAKEGTPVLAPLAGTVVLARNGGLAEGIGSTSFVLLAHNVKVGDQQLVFYSLYYHLAKEEHAPWMANASWQDADAGAVVPLAPPEPVQAGDPIGKVGLAGPDLESQIHWEIFALDSTPAEALDARRYWHEISGAVDQRICRNKEILGHGPDDHEWARRVVVSHYPEWSVTPDWRQTLREATKKTRRSSEIEAIYDKQIVPTLWWTPEIAKRLGLPAETRVYTYHPVGFLRWLNDLMGTRGPDATRRATGDEIAKAKAKAMLDIDDKEGLYSVHKSEVPVEAPEQKLQLPELIDGFGD